MAERHAILDSDWEVIYYKDLTKHMLSINTQRTIINTEKA